MYTFICPHYTRIFQGITWPAIIPLAAKWIPPNERSKFIANMMGKFYFLITIAHDSCNLMKKFKLLSRI